jgi:hypothetical protein
MEAVQGVIGKHQGEEPDDQNAVVDDGAPKKKVPDVFDVHRSLPSKLATYAVPINTSSESRRMNRVGLRRQESCPTSRMIVRPELYLSTQIA